MANISHKHVYVYSIMDPTFPPGVQGVGDALRHAALARASAPSGAAGLAPKGGGFSGREMDLWW